MNNLTFGDASFGYYETIAGGAGAGPHWAGQSGVHTHMTNTRLTDVEVLERRYPVLVRGFALRARSGGAGRFPGGDGVVRELEFLRPMAVGILSERRAFRPYGLAGGGPGAAGANFIVLGGRRRGGGGAEGEGGREGEGEGQRRGDEKEEEEMLLSLGAKNTYHVRAGDRIRICTPGA